MSTALFLVDPGTGGLKRTPVPSRGEEVLTHFALELKQLRVPASRLVGDEHCGAKVVAPNHRRNRFRTRQITPDVEHPGQSNIDWELANGMIKAWAPMSPLLHKEPWRPWGLG